ncbi:MAG TPA: peptidoglycan-binding domain-containing protein, partial [Candidatus Paceibacterota bacterium]|nr:peptidoglycan-binding domain-containing protein [Candidatus Paceibacterota bacterium]
QPDASFTTSDCPIISDPADSSSNSRSRSGSSIQSRVKNLMDMGNTVAANALKAQWPHLFGNPGTSTSVITKSSDDMIIRDLDLGMTGDDVLALQQHLNANGYQLAVSGAGAPGSETTYFGTRTKSALAKYQAAHGILPAVGYFGPITRAQMKSAGLVGLWW